MRNLIEFSDKFAPPGASFVRTNRHDKFLPILKLDIKFPFNLLILETERHVFIKPVNANNKGVDQPCASKHSN